MVDNSKATTATPGEQVSAVSEDVRKRDVEVTLTMQMGRTRCTLDQLLQFGENSLFELDRTVGEPIDILLNGKLCARGELVTVSENFGVRIVEILSPDEAT
jgi:flagellar motor switch protein FliN